MLLDVGVEGYPMSEVLSRMRASAAHATTPVILAGGATDGLGAKVSRVNPAAGAEAVAEAVERALTA